MCALRIIWKRTRTRSAFVKRRNSRDASGLEREKARERERERERARERERERCVRTGNEVVHPIRLRLVFVADLGDSCFGKSLGGLLAYVIYCIISPHCNGSIAIE